MKHMHKTIFKSIRLCAISIRNKKVFLLNGRQFHSLLFIIYSSFNALALSYRRNWLTAKKEVFSTSEIERYQ